LESTFGVYEVVQCAANLWALVSPNLYDLQLLSSLLACVLGSALLKSNTIQIAWIYHLVVIIFIIT
jgi:hypothetical protein